MGKNKLAYILLADGFEETEALTPSDMLKRGGIEVVLVSIGEEKERVSSHGVTVVADQTLADGLSEDYDLLVLPGGMPGTTNLRNSERMCAEVLKAAAQGKLIGAICAAPSVLGGLGLLKGRKATCYPGFEEYFEGATLTGEHLVEDGNFVMGIGAGVSFLFGLKLLERLTDGGVVDKVRKSIFLS